MIKKLRELKALMLMRIDAFRKSLLFEMLMNSKRWTLMAFSFGSSSVLFNLLTASLFLPSMMRVLDANKNQFLPLSKIDSLFSGFFVINQSYYFIFFICVSFFMFLKSFLMFVRELLGGKIISRHGLFLKGKVLRHFASKEISFFIREGTGFATSIFNNSVLHASLTLNSFLNVLLNFFSLVFSILGMIWISWPLFCVILVASFPLIIISKKIRIKHKKAISENTYSFQKLEQDHINFVTGMRFLKLANSEELEASRICEKSRKPYKDFGFISVVGFLNGQLNESFGMMCVIFLVSVSFLNIGKFFNIDSNVFLSFLMVLGRGVQSLSNLSGTLHIFNHSNLYLGQVQKLLVNKKEMDTDWGRLSLSSLESDIRFKGVSFVYPETQRLILNSIDLRFVKGKHVAIVGPSGSGKSTLVDLVLGFYRPKVGQVIINGKNYEEYKIKDYRRLFGLVSQESSMFFPTIRENLILFKPEASELEIRKALDQADALEFIDKLPDGIDTVIGERGVKLSGGQKQRLSIARALLHDPQILIFDEATSSLDSLSEARIIESIKKASVGRTSITVAHRLSTVMHCDKIIFLENGWIMEEGSPQELMSKHSRFRKYAESQNLKMSG